MHTVASRMSRSHGRTCGSQRCRNNLKFRNTKHSAKYIEKCIALDATDTVAQPGQVQVENQLTVCSAPKGNSDGFGTAPPGVPLGRMGGFNALAGCGRDLGRCIGGDMKWPVCADSRSEWGRWDSLTALNCSRRWPCKRASALLVALCAHATLSARGHDLSCGHGVSLEGPGHGKTAKPVTRWHSRKLSEARIRAVQCYDVPLKLVTYTLCSARAPHRSDTQHRALEAVI